LGIIIAIIPVVIFIGLVIWALVRTLKAVVIGITLIIIILSVVGVINISALMPFGKTVFETTKSSLGF
jgi:hypothetical protein